MRIPLVAGLFVGAFGFAAAAWADDVDWTRVAVPPTSVPVSSRLTLDAPPAKGALATEPSFLDRTDPTDPVEDSTNPYRLQTCCCPCGAGSGWRFEVRLGAWIWAATGDARIDGNDFDVDTTLEDSIDNLDLVDSSFTGSVRVRYNRWNLRATMHRLQLEDDVEVDGAPFEWSFDLFIAEIALGYCAAEIPLGCDPCSPCTPVLRIEPYVGARYMSFDAELEGGLTAPVEIEQSQSWWDPIVGVEAHFDFRNGWFAGVAADVGGFGVGSDFCWSAKAEVGYQFTHWFSVALGFAALDEDYEDGGFLWDATIWGPYLMFGFSF